MPANKNSDEYIAKSELERRSREHILMELFRDKFTDTLVCENYNLLSNSLYISDEIDHSQLINLKKALTCNLQYEQLYRFGLVPRPFNIFLSSYGGDLWAAFGMMNLIEQYPTAVHTHVLGAGLSAASMIFIAGDVRYLYPDSYLMLHELSFAYGYTPLSKMKNINVALDGLHEKMLVKLTDKSNKPKKWWSKKITSLHDYYITADEAVKLKLADVILDKPETFDFEITV
jgi:ATP-dependent protease ClpP protease subunit